MAPRKKTKSAPEQENYKDDIFPYCTRDRISGNIVCFKTRDDLEAYEKKEETYKLYDLKVRYRALSAYQHKHPADVFSQKTKRLYADILQYGYGDIDKYHEIILQTWGASTPDKQLYSILELLKKIDSMNQAASESLPQKIGWIGDDARLRDHLKALNGSGYLTFENINDVMAGSEQPKLKGKQRALIYVFYIWLQMGLIKNYYGLDKARGMNVFNHVLIENNFINEDGTPLKGLKQVTSDGVKSFRKDVNGMHIPVDIELLENIKSILS